MAFLFNSDAKRGAIFAETFARELPDIPFAVDPAAVDPDAVRYLITWTVPDNLHAIAASKSSSRSAPASTSSASTRCRRMCG